MDGTGEDGRWLTYGELAEVRGISKASATRMSFRHKWRRQAGNDGLVRVFVPASALHDKPHGSDMERMTEAIDDAITAFREQVDMERQRANAAEARADRAEARADRAEAKADELRDRLDRQSVDLEVVRRDAEAAQAAAARLRLDDEARKARGRLTRLRAAWRGE